MEIKDQIEINCDSDENSSHCAICNSKGSPHRPVLTFAGHQYHISCANLWLNCINPTLPQPFIYSLKSNVILK